MKQLKAKLKKQGGFTLVEMLIVVGIIAILVAVSIPLVSSSLEKARHATDAANERAAKAEILICYLTEAEMTPAAPGGAATYFAPGTTYYYDAAKGKLQTAVTGITPYGQHKTTGGSTIDHVTNGIIAIRIGTGAADNGPKDEVQMAWVKEGAPTTWDTGLCSTAKDGVKHAT